MTLNMEELNCEMFQLSIQFDEKKFKRDIFTDENTVKDESTNKGENLNAFVTHVATKKEHAHIEFSLRKKDSQLLMMFHQGGIEEGLKIGTEEESLENCAKVVSRYLPNTEFQADITSVYRFNKEFESVVQLQFPLLVKNELLREAVVSGHEIEFPEESAVDRIFISAKENSIIIVLSAKFSLKLKTFKLYSEMDKFSHYAQALVKKRANNE